MFPLESTWRLNRHGTTTREELYDETQHENVIDGNGSADGRGWLGVRAGHARRSQRGRARCLIQLIRSDDTRQVRLSSRDERRGRAWQERKEPTARPGTARPVRQGYEQGPGKERTP